MPDLGDGVSCWIEDPTLPLLFVQAQPGAFPSFDQFAVWIAQQRSVLDELIICHGGILLRGFPVTTAGEFSAFTGLFPTYQPGYVGGGSPRKGVMGNVLESTRYVETLKIPLHSEMAYLNSYPPRIAFFCKHASPIGGETIIGSMREFMRLLPRDLRQKLEQHEIQVIRNFAPTGTLQAAVDDSDKVTWDSAFNTQSRSEVEAHCRQLGLQESWNTDGGLTVITSMHAFTDHPKTGERFYRSHIHSGGRVSAETADASETTQQRSPSGYRFENGETLTSAETATITSIFDKIECSFPWSDGDIMMLDNLQVAHGRNPFSGQREVLVALLN